MKKLMLALMLCFIASPVFADKPPVVYHHKKKHKVVVVPPVVIPPSPPVVVPPVVVPPPPVVVVVPPPPVAPPVVVPPVPCKVGCPPESKTFIPSAHLAVGVGVQQPYVSGLVGLRMEFPSVYLGLEPFVSIPFGVGVDGLVYAYRGKVVQFYPLSLGFMVNWNYNGSGVFGTGNRFLSDQDVNRVIDMRLGMGVQVKVKCIKLTADLRTNLPDPVKLANDNGVCMNCGNGSRALNSRNAVGNAFAQSQLLLGVLF